MMKIMYVAGSSGGHITPLLSHIKKLKKEIDCQAFFITTDKQLDKDIIMQASSLVDKHYAYKLPAVPNKDTFFIKKYFSLLVYSLILFKFFLKSLFILKKHEIEKIYTTGSYVSIPVTLAARFLRIPIYIYHLDAVPGKANRFIHRYAQVAYLSYDYAQKYLPSSAATIIFQPCPIRFDTFLEKNLAQQALKVEDAIIIVIFGGSQGSEQINNIAIKLLICLPESIKNKIFIFHQTALQSVQKLKDIYKENGIKSEVFSYRFDLENIYAAADLVICRAGAVTLSEVIFFQKLAFVIPLRGVAHDHQWHNARACQEKYPQFICACLDVSVEAVTSRIHTCLEQLFVSRLS